MMGFKIFDRPLPIRSFLFLFFAALLSFGVPVFSSPSCKAIAKNPTTPSLNLSERLKIIDSAILYSIEDRAFPKLRISGLLYMGGELELSIYTKTPEGERSPLLNAKDGFQKIMKHFGDRVEAIKGHWVNTTDSGYHSSDNLRTFNQLILSGFSFEDAAKGTWTGQRAIESGFAKPTKVLLKGEPGNYTEVEVLFEK